MTPELVLHIESLLSHLESIENNTKKDQSALGVNQLKIELLKLNIPKKIDHILELGFDLYKDKGKRVDGKNIFALYSKHQRHPHPKDNSTFDASLPFDQVIRDAFQANGRINFASLQAVRAYLQAGHADDVLSDLIKLRSLQQSFIFVYQIIRNSSLNVRGQDKSLQDALNNLIKLFGLIRENLKTLLKKLNSIKLEKTQEHKKIHDENLPKKIKKSIAELRKELEEKTPLMSADDFIKLSSKIMTKRPDSLLKVDIALRHYNNTEPNYEAKLLTPVETAINAALTDAKLDKSYQAPLRELYIQLLIEKLDNEVYDFEKDHDVKRIENMRNIVNLLNHQINLHKPSQQKFKEFMGELNQFLQILPVANIKKLSVAVMHFKSRDKTVIDKLLDYQISTAELKDKNFPRSGLGAKIQMRLSNYYQMLHAEKPNTENLKNILHDLLADIDFLRTRTGQQNLLIQLHGNVRYCHDLLAKQSGKDIKVGQLKR